MYFKLRSSNIVRREGFFGCTRSYSSVTELGLRVPCRVPFELLCSSRIRWEGPLYGVLFDLLSHNRVKHEGLCMGCSLSCLVVKQDQVWVPLWVLHNLLSMNRFWYESPLYGVLFGLLSNTRVRCEVSLCTMFYELLHSNRVTYQDPCTECSLSYLGVKQDQV